MKREDNLAQTAGYKAQKAAADAESAAFEAANSVRTVANNFGNALDNSLERQPMTTLAMAVGVGFILGALWKA
jgi:ElaB/YqjD/DUF883 family membrane-anchored ribosome-binding protein